MTLKPNSTEYLSLHDLRNQMLNTFPQKDVNRFANLANRATLEMVDTITDYARLGQMTNNIQAVSLRKQLNQLSGISEATHYIPEFQPELVEVPHGILGKVQAIFLKPIIVPASKETNLPIPNVHSPIIIWDFGSEIAAARHSLTHPGKNLITTIRKDIPQEQAERQLVDFINLIDDPKFTVASGIRMVSDGEFANDVCQAVAGKIKTG